MNAALNRLGRACARRHRIVIVAWVLVALALSVVASRLGERTTDELTLPGTGSTKAAEALARTLPEQQYGSNPIVLHGKLTDEAIETTSTALRAAPHVTGVGHRSATATRPRSPSRSTSARRPDETRSAGDPRRRAATRPPDRRGRLHRQRALEAEHARERGRRPRRGGP